MSNVENASNSFYLSIALILSDSLIESGGAQIRFNGLQVDLLDSVLSGAGDIQVSGTADELRLVLSGLGNLNAADLESKKATIELSGMGQGTDDF